MSLCSPRAGFGGDGDASGVNLPASDREDEGSCISLADARHEHREEADAEAGGERPLTNFR